MVLLQYTPDKQPFFLSQLMVNRSHCRASFAAGMQRSLLEAVAKNVRLVECQRGSTVMREGDAGDHMYIIATGTCIVIKADSTLLFQSPIHNMGYASTAPTLGDLVHVLHLAFECNSSCTACSHWAIHAAISCKARIRFTIRSQYRSEVRVAWAQRFAIFREQTTGKLPLQP